MKTILIADDTPSMQQLLADFLAGQGYRPIVAADGEAALATLAHEQPDLVLLDVMMPKLDGFSVIQRIRKHSAVPIIMITAKRSEADIVRGFELGADDYIVKPFGMRVLLMRIRAVLRRSVVQSAENTATVGDITLNRTTRQVLVGGKDMQITPIEFCLLERLFDSVGGTVTREDLSLHLMENGYTGSESTLKVHIRNLRKKVEQDPANPQWIETVFGFGYRLMEEVA